MADDVSEAVATAVARDVERRSERVLVDGDTEARFEGVRAAPLRLAFGEVFDALALAGGAGGGGTRKADRLNISVTNLSRHCGGLSTYSEAASRSALYTLFMTIGLLK